MGFFKKNIGAKPQKIDAKPASISSELDSAVAFHRAGNFQQAEKICQHILAVEPENSGANHLLGLIALQQGDIDSSIQLISKAIVKDPSKAHYYSNLGNALQGKGRFMEATRHCEKAISLQPDLIEAHNNLGNALRATGHIDKAVLSYKQALVINPENKEALSNLGIALLLLGKADEAIKFFNKALSLHPSFAEMHYCLGRALLVRGRTVEAATSFNEAVSIKPLYADPHISLGDLYRTQDNLEGAVTHYRKALDINPLLPETANNLGNIMQEQGRESEAEECYRKAISLKPGFAVAYYNLGNVLRLQEKQDDAVECYKKALAINPEFAMACSHLGDIYHKQGKMAEAIASYEKALAIKPDIAETLNSLGMIFHKQGELAEAAEYFQKIITIEPNNLGALNNLGNVLLGQGKRDQAVECFHKAIAIKPDNAYTLNNLGVALHTLGKLTSGLESIKKAVTLKPDFPAAFRCLGKISYDLGKPAEAVKYYQRAMSLKPDAVKEHSNYLMVLNYLPDVSSQKIYKESLKWDEQHSAGLMKNEFSKFDVDIEARSLKIGYVSADFRDHSVSYFIEPLLKAHSRKKYKIYCYSSVIQPDNVTERLKSEVDQWTSIVGMKDEDVAGKIRNDGIDILVDLSGHSGKNRLLVFAYKPAPIQVTWLGYPNTTGMKAIDYRLTDEIADPSGEADVFYSEKLIRLDNGFLCYQPYASAPEVSPLPYEKDGIITFGSFNNIAKVNTDVIKLWAEILHAVPDSRLILKGAVSKQAIEKQFTETFNKHGVLSERVIFYDKAQKQEDHMALYSKIDIGLDPFPYNGTTTTCEALWMGVPVMTLLGERHAGRVGASIMHRLGFEDLLVAETPEEYIEKTSALALQTDKLTEIRGRLRSTMQQSSLCDADMFARTVEEVYTKMWAEYLKTR